MLKPYACRPEASRGRLHPEQESAHRTPFQRDRDRIIHAAAFRRLKHKTQVFVEHEGDHYRTRLTHTIEVAQVARTLCRVLALSEDLAEALALAHDLGHPPFGHAGETALNACMADHGGFDHNAHALTIVTALERRYAEFDGLNLTWETLEGLAKHNGPLETPHGDILAYTARHDLTLSEHAGAEAQVAAISDDIAYNNHDLDDGLRAGLIDIEEFFDLPLVGDMLRAVDRQYGRLDLTRRSHEALRRVFTRMVEDVAEETRRRLDALAPESPFDIRAAARPVVAFSGEMQAMITAIRAFLHQRMYRHYRVNRMSHKARRVVRELFEAFRDEPGLLPPDWRASPGAPEAEQVRRIAWFIAGMTDRFALAEHKRLFEPGARA